VYFCQTQRVLHIESINIIFSQMFQNSLLIETSQNIACHYVIINSNIEREYIRIDRNLSHILNKRIFVYKLKMTI